MSYPDSKAALSADNVRTQLRVEIQDPDGTWVDCSDRFDQNANRLISLGSGLTARLEKETGAFDVQLSTITVWNGDRFWDHFPPPNGVFNTPNFPTSFTWKRMLVRLTLQTMGGEEKLGIFVLDRVTTRAKSDQATLTLRSLTSFLGDAQADRVRHGSSWWQNKPTGFLVRRLLETRHKPEEVASWPGIQTSYQIPVGNYTGDGGIVVSAFGRPPETDRDYTIYGNPIACNNNAADPGFGDTWVGLEEELWKFNPLTGDWTYWSVLPAALVSLGYKIHRVFVSTLRQKVIALAWVPEFPTTDVAADRSGTKGAAIVTHSNIVVLVASLTAAPATLTEQAVPAIVDYYTGLFSLRSGKVAGVQVVIGGHPGLADANQSGSQIPNVTPHWLRTRQPGGRSLYGHDAWNAAALGGDDALMNNNTLTDYWMTEVGRYHNHFDRAVVGPRYPADYRFSIGQSACAAAFDEASDTIVLFNIQWDGGINRYKAQFCTHNIQTGVGGAAGVTGYYVMSGGEHYLPSSIQFNAAGNKVLVTAHRWDESAWSGGAPDEVGNDHPMGAIVVEYNWPLTASGIAAGQPTGTLHFYNTNFSVSDAKGRRRWIPLEAAYSHHSSGTRYAGITFLDYTKVGGACWGACLIQLGSTTTSGVRWSTGRQSGMALWAGLANTMVWNDAGTNCLVQIGDNVVSGSPAVYDQGTPPVDGDVGLAAGLAWNAALAPDVGVGGMMGISAPGIGIEQEPDAQILPANGKTYLFQLTYTMTDRVELADFSGMSVYEALVQLAAVGDFVQGYDDDGRYFFRLRARPDTAIATIKFNPNVFAGEIQASDASKDWGYDEIFNYCEIAPSRVILKPPAGTVRILERPAGWKNDPWNGEISVVQKGIDTVHVTLRCVEGGVLGDEVRGVIQKNLAGDQAVLHAPGAGEFRHRVRFAWLRRDVVIETQLLEDWPSNTSNKTIVVPYLSGYTVSRGTSPSSTMPTTNTSSYGDQVEIGDLITHIRDVVHDPAAGTTTLTLFSYNSTAQTPIPKGTRVVIRAEGDNQWSNAEVGVALSNDATGTKTPGAEGVVTTFEANATRQLNPGTIVRTRVATSLVGNPEHLVESVVDDKTWTGRRLGSGGDTESILRFSPLQGFIAPIVDPTEFPDGHVFWIADTGIGLIFRVTSRVQIFTGNTIETPFMVGDEIDVVADGLVLESEEMARAIGVNIDSQAKFRILPYRVARPSKFLNLRRARELANRIVNQLYGFPRYKLEVDLPLTFVPHLEDCYLVEDPGILPWDPTQNAQGDSSPVAPDTARAIAFTVTAYTLDPINGRLRVSLRAVNPHQY